MKIAVLSDTHAHSLKQVSPKIIEAIKKVDLVIHCGDFVDIQLFDELKKLTEVKAVRGNMDSEELKSILPEQQLIVIKERKIGIIHGWGSPWGIEGKIRKSFDDVEMIIYGHTHSARNEIIDGVHFFNPGSARHTYGLINIEDTLDTKILEA